MDLSVFLILLFVTLNFVAECYNWNQYRVKLGIFIATLIITLPNITFMVIDWWQSPHSKMALLVLNTCKPILRGETYRLFRWLKLSVGVSLASDDLNYLPITIPNNTSNFFMTKDCYDQASKVTCVQVIPEDYEDVSGMDFPFMQSNGCTGFTMDYVNETIHVHEFRLSRKIMKLWNELHYEDFISHRSFKSSLIREKTYSDVNVATATRLESRLMKIRSSEMPILSHFEERREWVYFRAASTLDYLNSDLVLIQGQGESIAVG